MKLSNSKLFVNKLYQKNFKQLFNNLNIDRYLSEIIYYSKHSYLVEQIQMERLRIRSMINQIKSHQATAAVRKNVEEDLQNPHGIIQNVQQKINLIHSCFILKPIDQICLMNQSQLANQEKRSSVTSAKQKQSKGKSRKIANHSYLSTINQKNKEQFENLQQLGIQTKKINGRNTRKTQINTHVDSQKINLFNKNQFTSKRQRKLYLKPPVGEYLNRKKSLPNKKMNIIYEDSKPQKQFIKKSTDVNYKTLEVRTSRLSKLKGLTINIPKSNRKNSDITPWQFESPLIKA